MNKETDLIFLCGFMGSGKTTIGRILADDLDYEFIDTDREIETKENKSIRDIFEQDGEAYFRRREAEIISVLTHSKMKAVAALGGGSLLSPDTLERVCRSGFLIYLKSDLQTLKERVKGDFKRPLLQTHTWEELFEKRKPGYEKASWILDTQGWPPARLAGIIGAFVKKSGNPS